jgi:succinate dehydrogenase / fumarate reductase cytochrome b subunit
VNEPSQAASAGSFLERNEFLLRRLHSLSGIVPVGAYLVVHLLTNAAVLGGAASFQKRVYAIHSLGPVLPLVEWVFIFLPLIYHAVYGVLITRGALPNSSTYRYTNNVRYTLQRATGMIAFLFIFWHVFHMHGWFHAGWWEHNVAGPLSGAMFRPFNAASTAAMAIQMSPIVPILYTIGILACVFHLANGIWTFGITWGIWVTPYAQRWATVVCLIFGLGLSAVGLGALDGFWEVNANEAQRLENDMYEQEFAAELKEAARENKPGPYEWKRYEPPAEPAPTTAAAAISRDHE